MRAFLLLAGTVATVASTALDASAELPSPIAVDPSTPLFRAADAVPFMKEAIAAHLDHRYAVTEHRQIVRSAVGGQAEGQFSLTTLPSASVTRFSYWNGDQEVRGELLERTDATKMYDTVTRAQRDPGILEEMAPGKYRFRIFPFAANEAKRVELRWEALLPVHGRAVEYRTPIARPNTTVVVDIDGAVPASVKSDTHDIETEALPHGGVRVRAVSPHGAPAFFALRYDLATTGPAAFVHEEPGGEAFVTLDFPAVEGNGPPRPRDVTFVVDRSGSESPDVLAHARDAVRAGILHLGKRDRVNVIAFDETIASLYPAPRDATDDVVREATAFTSKIRDGAGTDLGGALVTALKAQNPTPDHERIVVLLSDGGVDKSPSVAAPEIGKDVRVLAIGLGEAVDTALLGRIASAHGGLADVILPGEDASKRLVQLYDRSARPQLQNAKLELSGASAIELAAPVPSTIGPGERVNVVLRCRPRGVLHARLSGDLGASDPKVVTVDVDLGKAQIRPWVATAWGKAHMDSLFALGNEREAVEVALTYDLTSKHTAWFAIPGSEAARVRGQLDDARRRKRWLTADNDLAPPTIGGYDAPSSPPPPTMESRPLPAPPSRGESASVRTADVESVHGRGCAGCTTTRTSSREGAGAIALAMLGLGLVAVRRRNGGAS